MREAVLVMAYGTPRRLEDVEAYYTHIRRGSPPPPPLLEELLQRYRSVGGPTRLNRITREQAETFYAVHRERPFFRELVEFMISGPVVVQVLEGENAIARYREIMGATDPAEAAPATIRKMHARSIGENSVHGSDAADTAQKEIGQFFSGNEIVG